MFVLDWPAGANDHVYFGCCLDGCRDPLAQGVFAELLVADPEGYGAGRVAFGVDQIDNQRLGLVIGSRSPGRDLELDRFTPGKFARSYIDQFARFSQCVFQLLVWSQILR